ncbi:MAG: hypothetical protein J5590_02750 [Clostridia bacterium]|nr:hypothetical protein [Clostridia bacterium]
MTNKGLIVATLFTLSLLMGALTGIAFSEKKRADNFAAGYEIDNKSPEPSFIQTEKPKKPVAVSEKYMLTLTDTQIMIYKISADGSMQVIDEKPIDKDGLRREDYEKLYKGISFDALSDARETLEDYIN